MIGVYIFWGLFWAVPITVTVLFVISLCNYISAKKKNKEAPDTFSEDTMRKRKLFLIVMSALAGLIALMVIGLPALLYLAIGFM